MVSTLKIDALEEAVLHEVVERTDDLAVGEALGELISNEEINREPTLMIEAALGDQFKLGVLKQGI